MSRGVQQIELDNSVYEAGTKLSDLPVPGKAGSTFLGWCYDADVYRIMLSQ